MWADTYNMNRKILSQFYYIRNVAYCDRWSRSVVCLSVCQTAVLCKNSEINRGLVWGGDSWNSKAHCVATGYRSPCSEGLGKVWKNFAIIKKYKNIARIRCGLREITAVFLWSALTSQLVSGSLAALSRQSQCLRNTNVRSLLFCLQ